MPVSLPRLKTVVRAANVLVGLIIVLTVLAIAWFPYRALPQRSGELRAPVGQQATVRWDSLGVPHLTAGSEEDVWFLQGFVTAQERFWQMETLRRFAAGELSEIIGPATIQQDREMRLRRMRRIAEQHVRTLDPASYRALAAYARGVNHYLQTHRDKLPVEFQLVRFDPRPWRLADSVLIGLAMYRDLTRSHEEELRRLNLLSKGDRAKVEQLFASRTGLDMQVGSNAWAVAGARTQSGRPILANDMHLQATLPGTWFMTRLTAPGLDVTGFALPGLPGIIAGHNQQIAWGNTNLHFDVEDLYGERIDLRTGRYIHQGQPAQARPEREVIVVKGQQPVTVEYWVTAHGPILAQERGVPLALRWTAAEPNAFGYPFLAVNRARNWQEFRDAFRNFSGPGQNYVYADRAGNIGYQATGWLPIRRPGCGTTPADGSTGVCEWQGYLPFDRLPNLYNPPAGLIVTANQNPFGPDAPDFPVVGSFAAPWRARQIKALLNRRGLQPADMLTIQKDVYSAYHHQLAQMAVAALDRTKTAPPALRAAAGLLRPWNGQMEVDQSAPLLATLLADNLQSRIVERAAPGTSGAYRFGTSSAVVYALVKSHPKEWFANWDQELLGALDDAYAEARRLFGRRASQWNYGQARETVIPNLVLNQLPQIGSWFNVGPVPMSGAGTTVKQVSGRLMPSMRYVADLSDWDHSLANLPIGQSGHALSPHYRDQWNNYYVGTSRPMQFNKVQVEHTLTVRP